MESTPSPPTAPLELQRAEAAPYVTISRAPWWLSPTFGACYAAYVAAFVFWRGSEIAFVIALSLASVASITVLRLATRRYGALPMPGRGNPPPEIQREYWHYLAGACLIVGLVGLVGWWTGPIIASAAMFLLATSGMAVYQIRYERAAATVRQRLA